MPHEPGDLRNDHQIEQATGDLHRIAGLMWSYFAALRDHGFNTDQALAFARDYQKMFLGPAFGTGRGADDDS